VKPSVYHGLSLDAVRRLLPKGHLLPPSIREPISMILFPDQSTVESSKLRRAIEKSRHAAITDQTLLLVGPDFTLESCRLAAKIGAQVVTRGWCQWSDELCERTRIWKGARVKKPAW
jgi:hypothetical protein